MEVVDAARLANFIRLAAGKFAKTSEVDLLSSLAKTIEKSGKDVEFQARLILTRFECSFDFTLVSSVVWTLHSFRV